MRPYSRRRRLMNLPIEILTDILKRLPAKTLCHLRCVSKTLLRIVDCPSFVALHTAGLASEESPHLLIRLVRTNDDDQRHVTSLQSLEYESGNDHVDVSHMFSISVDREAIDNQYNVYFVFNNLFCMKHLWNHDLCFLIDPFRGDVLQLPESNNNVDVQVKELGVTISNVYVVLGMGLNTITNTYKIVRVSQFVHTTDTSTLPHVEEGHMVAEVLVLGTTFWRKISSTPPYCVLLGTNNVHAYGDMHWFVNGYTVEGMEGPYPIVSFDFQREEFYWTPNPAVGSWVFMLHLISLRGSMAVVDTSSPANIEIWVMKDYHKKEWARENVINLLDLGFEFRCWFAVCGEWEHGVFFINEEGTTPFFLDKTSVTVNRVMCPTVGSEHGFWACRRILSLHGSLMSLKGYTDRVELKSLPLVMTCYEQNLLASIDEDDESYLLGYL